MTPTFQRRMIAATAADRLRRCGREPAARPGRLPLRERRFDFTVPGFARSRPWAWPRESPSLSASIRLQRTATPGVQSLVGAEQGDRDIRHR